MKENLQKIKEACIKVNPEIANQPCTHKIMADENGCPIGTHIRPVRLADVLLAIGSAIKINGLGGFSWFIDNEWKDVALPRWNLKEDLDHQSEETINFIASLL